MGMILGVVWTQSGPHVAVEQPLDFMDCGRATFFHERTDWRS